MAMTGNAELLPVDGAFIFIYLLKTFTIFACESQIIPACLEIRIRNVT